MNKKILVIAFLVTAIVLCFVFIIWSQQSSKSTITQPQTVKPQEAVKPQVIDTAYFTETLPSGFEVKSNVENATGQDLIQIVATKPHSSGQQIAITVGVLPTEGISGVASYNLRIKMPQTYSKLEFGGMPAGVPTFYSETNNVYEITSFWPHVGLYAGISVSGLPAQKSELNQILAALLSDWQWR